MSDASLSISVSLLVPVCDSSVSSVCCCCLPESTSNVCTEFWQISMLHPQKLVHLRLFDLHVHNLDLHGVSFPGHFHAHSFNNSSGAGRSSIHWIQYCYLQLSIPDHGVMAQLLVGQLSSSISWTCSLLEAHVVAGHFCKVASFLDSKCQT